LAFVRLTHLSGPDPDFAKLPRVNAETKLRLKCDAWHEAYL